VLRNGMTEQEMRQVLTEVVERIGAGGLKSLTVKALTTRGELEYTFALETEEQQLAAVVALKKILGQVH
jgi:hypothetical protein